MTSIPLNPDALEVACDAVIDASFGQELPEAPIDLATAAVSAYLGVAQPVVNSVDSQSTPEGHYDAWRDTGDGYTQRKGWTLTCLWCGSEFTGATKSEALKGYRGHEESIMRALREADAERAKNRPTVNDA